MERQPVVAILSPGQMGSAIGRVLAARGPRVIAPLAGRSERTIGLARSAGIEDVGTIERVVAEADVILSVTTSVAAPLIGSEVAALLRSGRVGRTRPLTFVECNALAPQNVRAIAAPLLEAGCRLVDAGIVGGPPTATRGPRFYASGPHIDDFLAFRDFGLDVRPLGHEIGQASAMKMSYAALTKGLIALGSELLLVAGEHDLLDPLLDELESSQPALRRWLESSIPGMPSKARRWVSEMLEISATFDDLGLSPGYHRAASDLYAWIEETPLGAERPEARDAGRDLRATLEGLARGQRPRGDSSNT